MLSLIVLLILTIYILINNYINQNNMTIIRDIFMTIKTRNIL